MGDFDGEDSDDAIDAKDFALSDWPPGLCGRFGEPR